MMTKLRFQNNWFDTEHLGGMQSTRQLPGECVADCSGSGAKDEIVDYWVNRLSFDAPAWLLRQHLREFGCWDAGELCDHQENLRRTLWIWANDVWERPGECDYLWLSC